MSAGIGQDLVLGGRRELGTLGLVAALASGYAAVLVMAADALRVLDGGSALIAVVATVFLLIALYVAAVVMTNAVTVVVAGRLRRLALLRMLGASVPQLRTAVLTGVVGAGATGAVAGAAAGLGVAALARGRMQERGVLPVGTFPWFSPWLALTTAAVVLTAAVAGRVGSARVTTSAPAPALVRVEADEPPSRRANRGRAALGVLMILAGAAMLARATLLGESSGGAAAAFLIAFAGSAASATGVLVGARLVLPASVAALGRVLGSDPPSLVARRNAVTDPQRTTRSTIGLVVGVTLVTTFSTGGAALAASVDGGTKMSPAQQAEVRQALEVVSAVLVGVVVVSALLAAVGLVGTMSLTVLQRTREIGLLRALGFTGPQIRSMIFRESLAMTGAATLLGTVLGLVYGTVGAQAILGLQHRGLVVVVPPTVGVVAVAAALLVLVSSWGPARRAVAMPPVRALRVEG